MPNPTLSPRMQSVLAALSHYDVTLRPYDSLTLSGGKSTTFELPRPGLVQERRMIGLMLRCVGRLNIGTANATLVSAESPQNLFSSFTVLGQQRGPLGDQTIFNLPSATLSVLNRLYAGTALNNSVTPALIINTGNYDFDTSWFLPFIAEGVKPSQEVETILNAPAFNSLRLQATIGDGFTLASGVAGGSTRALSASGGNTGSPTLQIVGVFANLGTAANSLKQKLIKRTMQQANYDASQGLTTDVKIAALNVGNRISRIYTKAGVRPAASASTASPAFDTLSDGILTKLTIKKTGTVVQSSDVNIRNQWNKYQRGNETHPTGYSMVDFLVNGDMDRAFDTRGFNVAGATLDVYGDVTTAANQAIEVFQEEIIDL